MGQRKETPVHLGFMMVTRAPLRKRLSLVTKAGLDAKETSFPVRLALLSL